MRRLLLAVLLVVWVGIAEAQWSQSKIVYSLNGGLTNRVVLFAGTPTTNFIFASSLTLTDLTNSSAWSSNSWIWIGTTGLWLSNSYVNLSNDYHYATNFLWLNILSVSNAASEASLQALLTNGTRYMGAPLNLGTNDIVSVKALTGAHGAAYTNWILGTPGTDGGTEVAASSNGTYITIADANVIRISSDHGATWGDVAGDTYFWSGLAMSLDGRLQYGSAQGASRALVRSINYGSTWAKVKDSENTNWTDIACSGDGTQVVAITSSGPIYNSMNAGTNWIAADSSRDWNSVCMSSNGQYRLASVVNGRLYVSSDYGLTWTAQEEVRDWEDTAMSHDGSKMFACDRGGLIYRSLDYGSTWSTGRFTESWASISVSGNGSNVVAASYGESLWYSFDSGATWAEQPTNQYQLWKHVFVLPEGTGVLGIIDTGSWTPSVLYESSLYPDRVMSNMAVRGDLLPEATEEYSLGNRYRAWADLWLSGGTIYMRRQPVVSTSTNSEYAVFWSAIVVSNGATASTFSNVVVQGIQSNLGPVFIQGTNVMEDKVSTNDTRVLNLSNTNNQFSVRAPDEDTDAAQAGWVRSLFDVGTVQYITTNNTGFLIYGTNAFYSSATLPTVTVTRTYSGLTNNTYCGASVTTGTYTEIQGPIVIDAALGMSGGSANRSMRIEPQIYYYYNTNSETLYGDWAATPQTVLDGTNHMQWVVSFAKPSLTGAVHLVRVWKVTEVSGTPNKPNLLVVSGTNAVFGTNSAAHFAFTVPASGGGSSVSTNGLAPVTYVDAHTNLTGAAVHGLGNAWETALTNGFVTSTVTNGLLPVAGTNGFVTGSVVTNLSTNCVLVAGANVTLSAVTNGGTVTWTVASSGGGGGGSSTNPNVPYFLVNMTNGMNQAFSAQVNTLVAFSNAVYDTASGFVATNSSYKVQVDGKYVFFWSARSSVTYPNGINCSLYKNGALVYRGTLAGDSPDFFTVLNYSSTFGASPPIALVSNDYMQIYGGSYQACDLLGSVSNTWFGGYRLVD